MDEINWVKVWADRASLTYTELRNQLDALHLEHAQLLRERNELVADRDALRRSLCQKFIDPNAFAESQGWNCFNKDT
jgi:hypothetical protein